MKYLQITPENVDTILDLFAKTVDKDGFIVEKDSKKRLICPYSREPIHKNSFSIIPGSAIFVNNYPFCFAEHLAKIPR